MIPLNSTKHQVILINRVQHIKTQNISCVYQLCTIYYDILQNIRLAQILCTYYETKHK